jgi:hypothetical protein
MVFPCFYFLFAHKLFVNCYAHNEIDRIVLLCVLLIDHGVIVMKISHGGMGQKFKEKKLENNVNGYFG